MVPRTGVPGLATGEAHRRLLFRQKGPDSHPIRCLDRHRLTPANEEIVGEVAVLGEEGQRKKVVQVDPLHQQPAVVGQSAVLHKHSGCPAPCRCLGNGKGSVGRPGKLGVWGKKPPTACKPGEVS